MKVQQTSKLNYDTPSGKCNLALQTPSLNQGLSKDSVSFGNSLQKGLVKSFDWVDRKGFLVDFLIIDALSMITPRVLIGLNRDREKTGKINYKAGAEEAGRELTSGPSMMVIPIATLLAYRHFSPASHMEKSTLEGLTNSMKSVVNEADTELLTSHEDLNKKLAEKVFEDAFCDETKFKFDSEEAKGLKSRFIDLLNDSTKTEKKLFGNKEFKAKAKAFEEHVVLINNRNTITQPLDTKTVNLKSGGVGASHLFEDFHNYSKDVVKKFVDKDFAKNNAENFKSSAVEFLEKAQKWRSFTKVATAMTGFLAVGAFLLYLPKLYQQGKVSPAMESAKRASAVSIEGGANENK